MSADGAPVQQNIVRTEGRRSALVTILKNGDVSTLNVVNTIKNKVLPVARAAAPKGLRIDTLFDQSVFVAKAIGDVMQEGATAAGLAGRMIFVFLGSRRSNPGCAGLDPALDLGLLGDALGTG